LESSYQPNEEIQGNNKKKLKKSSLVFYNLEILKMFLFQRNLRLMVVFLIVLVAFIEESVGKPQCGLRWRSPCSISQVSVYYQFLSSFVLYIIMIVYILRKLMRLNLF